MNRVAKIDRWLLMALLIASLFSMPILVIVGNLLTPAVEIWAHLAETVLKEYIGNTAILAIGVVCGTLAIGVPAAWFTSMCRFPGVRLFEWAMLLPLAMPAYIIAYTYTGMLDFSGPVQSLIREWSGWGYGDYWFPEVRSIWGAIVMLSLVLYPYVYLMARAAFLEQSVTVMEVSRTLGHSPRSAFFKIAMPLARPAIVAGVALALMETLADYGTVQYFGVSTFTTGIFRTWFGLGDSGAAAQLAALLLAFVIILILVEKRSRKAARYYHGGVNAMRALSGFQLQGWQIFWAIVACSTPLLLGFILPAIQLSAWAVETWADMVDDTFYQLIWNSLALAGSTAVLAVVISLFLAYAVRVHPNRMLNASVRFASLGYAIPGVVIAIGVTLPLAWFDNQLDGAMRNIFDISTGLIFSGTLFALMFGYLIRFLAVSLQSVESGYSKISPRIDEAARSLGTQRKELLFKIHLPMLKGTLITALLLVFVDIMKELPATLVLRPFNFNTLAVRAFELASDERLADSSTAALAIIVTGLIPVIILSYTITRSRSRRFTTTRSES